jgi:hypothetical protein
MPQSRLFCIFTMLITAHERNANTRRSRSSDPEAIVTHRERRWRRLEHKIRRSGAGRGQPGCRLRRTRTIVMV